MSGHAPLHVSDQGHGPPVVFVHGIGTTCADPELAGLTQNLCADRRVISVDRPGYGASARPNAPCPPDKQADLIAHTLTDLGVGSAVVVGHSFGTLPAAALAVRHPQLVAGMVLLGGVYFTDFTALRAWRLLPKPPSGFVRRVGPPLTRAAVPALIRLSFWPDSVPQRFSDGFPLGAVSQPRQLAAQIDDIDSIKTATGGLPVRCAALHCPMILMAGSRDGILSARKHTERLASLVPGASLHLLEGAGHMIHHTHTADVAGAIRAL